MWLLESINITILLNKFHPSSSNIIQLMNFIYIDDSFITSHFHPQYIKFIHHYSLFIHNMELIRSSSKFLGQWAMMWNPPWKFFWLRFTNRYRQKIVILVTFSLFNINLKHDFMFLALLLLCHVSNHFMFGINIWNPKP